MTANIKIPVASAENVTAVPLAAVFTEKNPETGQYERFVYVLQGDVVGKAQRQGRRLRLFLRGNPGGAFRRVKWWRSNCRRKSAKKRAKQLAGRRAPVPAEPGPAAAGARTNAAGSSTGSGAARGEPQGHPQYHRRHRPADAGGTR